MSQRSNRVVAAVVSLLVLLPASKAPAAARPSPAEIAQREADWRNGAVVYQVIVDRFAPPANLEAKRSLYPAPKVLRQWSETPKQGHKLNDFGVWSHEIDFWGGDLASLVSKLDYITSDLHVDVLYLNPIHLAYTNHKYDAQDYFQVSPEYGTREDVKRLAQELHRRGKRLMLDGVFNHMGRTSTWFKEAASASPNSKQDWFFIGPEYKLGYRAWYNVENLPELRMENPAVRARIFGDVDSVIQGYLRDGVDGWRLDVAFDIGYGFLGQLTRAAHRAKPSSLVIGEIWNYPEEWFPAVDGIMNMTAREIVLQLANGSISGPLAARQLDRMVTDCGLDHMLKSWIILDNHDTPRLRNSLKQEWQQRLAQVLQFTLPGSPCVYYGVELGMEGGGDPEQRAPMRWDLVTSGNPQLEWTKHLIDVRHSCRALRFGDFRLLDSDRLIAFARRTDRVADTVVVVANTAETTASDVLVLRDSSVMSGAVMVDELSGQEFPTMAGTMSISLPAHSVVVLRPRIGLGPEYTPFKRVP